MSLGLTLPLWPLLSAALVGIMLASGRFRGMAHVAVIAGALVAAVLGAVWFVQLAPAGDGHGATGGVSMDIAPWFSLGDGQMVGFNYYLDGLTGVMLLVVTSVALMVVIYSVGYMKDHHGHRERGYERFFAFLGLFIFSMLMLVLAGNFVLLYLGWELVGLCSYLLIGFYYRKPEAAAAAKKAFLVNRIGDFGFALGIFALYQYILPHVQPGENALDYAVVFRHAAQLTADQVNLVCLLLFCGAMGKSAQIPLYVWLPDAMEGPSPVSALIHAATMVTAGVYMVARCGPLFANAPDALEVVTWVGAIGAIYAATMAMAQYDMKRILAYSTMSQLAYMFVALGCGAPDSAVFHLYTHAFFKALLFLGAGSVMHAMGNVIDLREFSGLRSVLPTTQRLMLIGCLALAGFPLLSGFWSKDEILHAALEHNFPVFVILLLTSFMTAYYTFRMYFLCFHGPLRLPAAAGAHPHDAPPVMVLPMTLLAAGAVLAGYLGVAIHWGSPLDSFLFVFQGHGWFHHYVHNGSMVVTPVEHGSGSAVLYYVSAAVGIVGIWMAWRRYGTAPQDEPDRKSFGPLWLLWHARYYVDEIFDAVFVQPLRALGRLFFAVDRAGVDGAVNAIGGTPRALGAVLRVAQNGMLQSYALTTALGIAVLALLWRFVGTP
ncbi:MAG: NADH-quinone oxidoreductase subunit L [Phycisphaerales bacterium]|nr:NADH-quinone oxidoreductase subunit L [Phycisphaerales bacterium]